MKTHAIHATLCAIMVLIITSAAPAAETTLDKIIQKTPDIYLRYDAPEVLPQSQVATIALQLGMDVRIDDKPLYAFQAARFDKKPAWAIVDLPPGPHTISAKPPGSLDTYQPPNDTNLVEDIINLFESKETKAARTAANAPRPNVFKQTIMAAPGQIHVLTYITQSTSSKINPSMTRVITTYLPFFTENKDPKLRDTIDTHRQQYKKQLAAMPPMTLSHNPADWGKKRLSIPVPDRTTQFDMVVKSLENAFGVPTKEFSGDNIFIGSFKSKPLHKAGLYMKYNNSTADIYGEELSDEQIKRIKTGMPESLKFATPAQIQRFTLEYPANQWGIKLADTPFPAGQTLGKIKDAITRAMNAYHWRIENSNDSLIIGSLLSRGTKYALYVKYDTNRLEIYGDKNMRSNWADNVKKGALKLINAP